MKPGATVWSLSILFLFLAISSAKVLQGTVESPKNTVFLGKFTYSETGSSEDGDVGVLDFQVSNVSPVLDTFGNIKLNFYTDEEDERWYFPEIWNSDVSCTEKVALQHPVGDNGAVKVNGTDLHFTFSNYSSPRTWFWTTSDCKLFEGQYLQMEVRMHWKNPGGWWYEEFSLEDQNLLTIFMILTFVYAIFTPVVFVCIFVFYINRNFAIQTNMGMFVIGVFLHFVSTSFYLVHYLSYASNGIGVPMLFYTADVFQNLAVILMMLVVIQVGSLVSSPLNMNAASFFFTFSLLLFYFAFFLGQIIYPGLYPTELVYKWETSPGICMLIIQIGIWSYYVLVSLFNARSNPSRRVFLLVFLIVFSIWFAVLPLSVSFLHLAPFYSRYKWVLAITETTYLFCYAFFLLAAIPSPVSKLLRVDPENEEVFNTEDVSNDL